MNETQRQVPPTAQKHDFMCIWSKIPSPFAYFKVVKIARHIAKKVERKVPKTVGVSNEIFRPQLVTLVIGEVRVVVFSLHFKAFIRQKA